MIIFLIVGCNLPSKHKNLSAIESLPNLRMITIDSSTRILPDDIPKGCPVILIYFDPDCEHCQKVTDDLILHMSELGHAKIYMVTNNPSHEALEQFYQKNRLDKSQNIIIAEDYKYSFYRLFKPSAVPYIAIYNAKKSLVKIYQGETDVNSIISGLRE